MFHSYQYSPTGAGFLPFIVCSGTELIFPPWESTGTQAPQRLEAPLRGHCCGTGYSCHILRTRKVGEFSSVVWNPTKNHQNCCQKKHREILSKNVQCEAISCRMSSPKNWHVGCPRGENCSQGSPRTQANVPVAWRVFRGSNCECFCTKQLRMKHRKSCYPPRMVS